MCNIESILREELTEKQYNAAIDPAREILCLACAGSGKSRTLAYRIAWLVANGTLISLKLSKRLVLHQLLSERCTSERCILIANIY